MKPYLSVIIPAYNEAKRLPPTLVDVDRYLSAQKFSSEIIVIDGGSKDETPDIVKKMSAQIKNLKIVQNQEGGGKGVAVRQGMLLAQGDIRLFMDADNATSLDQFDTMKPWFSPRGRDAKRFDVVIGSRAIKGAKLDPPQPFYKQLLGKAGNLWIQLLNLPGIWDTQCGFKVFTAEAAEKVFSLSRIAGWGFDIEVLSLARAMGLRIKEVPVHWVNDLSSHVTFADYLKVLLENVRIRWWLVTNSYNLKGKIQE